METEKGYWNWQFIELLGLEIPFIRSSTCPAEHVEQRGKRFKCLHCAQIGATDSFYQDIGTDVAIPYNGFMPIYNVRDFHVK